MAQPLSHRVKDEASGLVGRVPAAVWFRFLHQNISVSTCLPSYDRCHTNAFSFPKTFLKNFPSLQVVKPSS